MRDWGAVLGLVEEGLGVDCVEGGFFGEFDRIELCLFREDLLDVRLETGV